MSANLYRAYLQGALHDGTYSALHNTHRISQKGTDWLELLGRMFTELGCRSWMYREGKDRDVYVLETTAPFLDVSFDPETLLTNEEAIAYVRGYFDAEGGLPRTTAVRFYLQLSQKNFAELKKVRAILENLGIHCGQIHNPSSAVDPDYWRFYVRTRSHRNFLGVIGSWHPRKRAIVQAIVPFACGLTEPALVRVPVFTC